MLDWLAQNLDSHSPHQDISHSSEPFAERSRSELTTGVGSLGFDSAQPTEQKLWNVGVVIEPKNGSWNAEMPFVLSNVEA